MKIRFTDEAWDVFTTIDSTHQDQARRLLRAIVLGGGRIGRPWNHDQKGRLHWVVSAVDTHLVYRMVFRRSGDTLYITDILIFPTPPDPNDR